MSQKFDLQKLRADFSEYARFMKERRLLSDTQAAEFGAFIRELVEQRAVTSLQAIQANIESQLEWLRRDAARLKAIDEMRASAVFQRGGLGRMPQRLALESGSTT